MDNNNILHTLLTTIKVSIVLRSRFVTVQEETVQVASLYIWSPLMTEEIHVISMITLNTNLDFKYTQNAAPTKINNHGNF